MDVLLGACLQGQGHWLPFPRHRAGHSHHHSNAVYFAADCCTGRTKVTAFSTKEWGLALAASAQGKAERLHLHWALQTSSLRCHSLCLREDELQDMASPPFILMSRQ